MEMWGDAEGAYSLEPSDPLAKSLHQISGPEHIPYNDSRWQHLLLQYERLVHLHNLGLAPPSSSSEEADVVGKACRQCAKNCCATSNLAAFCLHVARMIRDLQASLDAYAPESKGGNEIEETSSLKQQNGTSGGSSVKQRISLIGKARVTCGAINLLRILSHETIVQTCCSQEVGADSNYLLAEAFTYRNRTESVQNDGQDAAMELIASTMVFLASIGLSARNGSDADILAIPEMYDVVVQILSLLLVLLSTQLYQPMISSAEIAAEGKRSHHYFLEKWMEYSRWQGASARKWQKNKEELMRQQQAENLGQESAGELQNEPLLFLRLCLHWLVDRPSPPRRSIASHYVELPKSIAHQMANMTLSPDGMYESHSIQFASAPKEGNAVVSTGAASVRAPALLDGKTADTSNASHQTAAIALGSDDTIDLSSAGHVGGDISSWNATPSNLIFHPIRSILLLSSTVFLLPIRLVRLAFNLLGHRGYRAIMSGGSSHHLKNMTDGDQVILQQIQAHCEQKSGWSKTNNILWLTDSPVADLGSALMLLLSSNCRYGSQNPFQSELASMSDNRWVNDAAINEATESSLFPPSPRSSDTSVLSINFESVFEALGRIAYTEVGALMLYTLLLSAPAYAESISARSDLDTLVMPLLRSLYFSTTTTHHGQPKGTTISGQLSELITLTPENRPFRSQSQLYVILILLLIFSQDPSFGRDSFRRVHIYVSAAKWYKEKRIKEASLGSMILLVLLRAVSFNLNRLQDAFLLSNCCAVLLNLSPHITDLGEYAADRLVSVTTSCFKIYTQLVAECGGVEPEEGDLSSSLGMHGETCRTLLTLVKHAIRRKCFEKNIHLAYALLREQRHLHNMHQFPSLGDLSQVSALIEKANSIIQESGDGMTAEQTLGVLKQHVRELKTHYNPEGYVSDADSLASDASDLGNLTFTYEEEADPEVFFVPYVWDVIVGTLSTTTMEWSRNNIRVFPLNEDVFEPSLENANTEGLESIDEGPHDKDNTPDVV